MAAAGVQLALARPCAAHVVGEQVGELMVFQSPSRCDEHVGGRLGREAVEHDVGAQAAYVFGKQADVFIGRIQMERMLGVFVGEARAADYLQLVYFQRV